MSVALRRTSVVLLLVAVLPALAQEPSLGEVAERSKRERAERRARGIEPRAFDDRHLEALHEVGSGGAEAPAEAAAGDAAEPEPEPEPRTSYEVWAERARQRREALREAQAQVSKAEQRIRELGMDTDPSPGDLFDPNRLQNREAERNDLRARLPELEAQVSEAEAALEALLEDARRAAVPRRYLEAP